MHESACRLLPASGVSTAYFVSLRGAKKWQAVAAVVATTALTILGVNMVQGPLGLYVYQGLKGPYFRPE